jgi:RNA polymerase sigma-70 factor (ECF subfamily)
MVETLPTDEELYRAMRLNDRKAFNLLYERYWELVYKKAFSYLHDTEAAGEITNDIFLNIWLKRDVLEIITFQNYLTAAARYRVYNHLKAKKRLALTYVEDYKSLKEEQTSTQQEDTFMPSEIYQWVNHLLEHLPKRCKEIFLLSRIGQLSNSEIATKLEISKRTVENQISIAVKHLRSHFGNFFCFLLLVTTLLKK